LAWYNLPILRSTPLAKQRQEDEEYSKWLESEKDQSEWPEWVYSRWQADMYDTYGGR
jgi:hypothetical protein